MTPTKIDFREGDIKGVVLTRLQRHEDARGWLVELFRDDESPREFRPAMAYVSQTLPGMARGPHEHRLQTDCFAFLGPGEFKVYLWDARAESPTYGHRQALTVGESNRVRLLVPPGVVHAYRNIGSVPGLVVNLPDALYAGWGRREPVDEIRHEGSVNSPFVLD